MIAITVDDEMPMLFELTESVRQSPDIRSVTEFRSCTAALDWVRENPVDIAFLDIQMRGMGGLALAENIQQLRPDCRIIFCTGHSEYALDAFRIHVSGYLLKPITPEAVQKEIDHIKSNSRAEKRLRVQCFGSFEVFADGKPLTFRRSRSKELFAYLVDRNGAGVSPRQICAVLWEAETDDEKNMNYFRQLVNDLRNTLRSVDAEEVLKSGSRRYYLDMDLLDCDYTKFLRTGSPRFLGEYMSQYSWAESTCAMLLRK